MRISLEKAYQLLMSGHVVGVPTETVYGLAASIERPAAINQIFSLKGRPSNNPLIVHIAHPQQILSYVSEFPDGFDVLTKAFWPGPLTLILPTIPNTIPKEASTGLPTAAFRMPNHSLALALLEWVGPLVMPSANVSGSPSSTRREHVENDFGLDFPILDGGHCGHGLESTILSYSHNRWHIARLGAISAEAFEPVLNYAPTIHTSATQPVCPGHLHRHYAPKAKLHLCPNPNACLETTLGFLERSYPNAKRIISLGSLNNPASVAENLYAVLRFLDDEQVFEAYVDIDFPSDGLWSTILERLQKAAAH
ncbi:MAG: threonylcarbamoyl-AMP synthase [Parachlamydiaceae bacterium]|nr:threonylcarbamoyl-AMP synthase [Parachlamydiaceae bacterium]